MENNVINISNLQTILTVGVAIAAFVSPTIVALINNWFTHRIRKSELDHAEKVKQIECDHALALERLAVISSSKNQVFLALIDCLSEFYENPSDKKLESALIAAIYKAALYCDDRRIQNNVFTLIYDVKSGFSEGSGKTLDRFQKSMESLLYALRFEIYGSTPSEYTAS